jgi:ribosomal protein S18 acetylase RimI-like enzyme
MDVTLVEVRESEYDDFFAMYEPYVRELDPYDPAGPAPAGYLDQYRRAVLDDMEGRELLWILAGGARAGLIVVRTQSDWPDESRAVASIAEFYVLPEFRRARTGTAAVKELLAEHRRRGTDEIEADILRDNEPARGFWASLGFEVQMYQTSRKP